MKIELFALSDQLLTAALNGLWQGTALTLAVAGLLRLARRTNAATRHAVWFATLFLLVGLLIAHGWHAVRELRSQTVATQTSIAEATTSTDPIVDGSIELLSVQGEESSFVFTPDTSEGQLITTPLAFEDYPTTSIGATPPPELHPLTKIIVSAFVLPEPWEAQPVTVSSAFANFSSLRRLAERLANPFPGTVALGLQLPEIVPPLLLAAWLSLAGIRCGLIVFRLQRIRLLKRSAVPANGRVYPLFKNIYRRLGIRRTVKLGISADIRSPLLLGFVRPMIVLPLETKAEEADEVLRHELAHVQRWDDWFNLLQHCIHAVFFFHPAVGWICRRLSLEREIACDDYVLQESGRSRYALLLADLAGRMQGSAPLLAPGASTNKSQLKQRIDMILDPSRNKSPRLARTKLGFLSSLAALFAVTAIYLLPRFCLAQADVPPAPTPPPADVALAAPPATPAVPAVPPVPPVASIPGDFAPPPGGPAGIGRGPKTKAPTLATPYAPGHPMIEAGPHSPHALTIPAVPGVPPAPMIAQGQPAPERTPAPARAPREPRAPRADGSLEERMARLEQMVQSLVDQRNVGPGHFEYHLKVPNKYELEHQKHLEHSLKHAIPDQKEIERIKEKAKREAERAVEESKRAGRAAGAAARADSKRLNAKQKEQFEQQLQGLRRQLETLERQRNTLDRQIERLERDREKLEEGDEQDEDQDEQNDFEGDLKPDDVPAAKPCQ